MVTIFFKTILSNGADKQKYISSVMTLCHIFKQGKRSEELYKLELDNEGLTVRTE